MFFWGHIGFTAKFADYLIEKKRLPDKKWTYAAAIIIGMLPDIIDKPVAVYLMDVETSRVYMHALIVHVFLLTLVLLFFRQWIYYAVFFPFKFIFVISAYFAKSFRYVSDISL